MSQPCAKSELLIFEPLATQVCVNKGSWLDIHPLNSVDSIGPITFHIPGSDECYYDLNDTAIYLKCSVDGLDSTKVNDDIAPVNLLLSSLFSDVEVSVNSKLIEGNDFLYPYKSYISNILTHDTSMKKTQLYASGYVKDEAKLMDDKTNIGHVKRSKWIQRGKSFELMGALSISFFHQSKYLIPKVNISIKLSRAKQTFFMMNFGESKFTFKINSAVLYVRRCFIQPSIVQAHEDGLKHHNALYPIQKNVITNYAIAKGSSTDNREIIMGVDVPKLLIVGLVENSAFNGDYKKSPFNFQNFNLSFLSLMKNGESIPYPSLQLDYKNNSYLRAYMSTIQSMELFTLNESNAITLKDFKNGTNLYAFNLTPDLNYLGTCSQKYENCNLRMDIKFAQPLETSINVIIYSIYDSSIEITRDRNVLTW